MGKSTQEKSNLIRGQTIDLIKDFQANNFEGEKTYLRELKEFLKCVEIDKNTLCLDLKTWRYEQTRPPVTNTAESCQPSLAMPSRKRGQKLISKILSQK